MTKAKEPAPTSKIDPRAFYFEGDDIGYSQILIKMARSELAIRALTRVMVRYILTDREGVEHTFPEKKADPWNYPSYISPVWEVGSDYYLLTVDTEILPAHRVTLLKILLEELASAKLDFDEVTVPPQTGKFGMKIVGPSADEVFGDVPYDGWRPLDLLQSRGLDMNTGS